MAALSGQQDKPLSFPILSVQRCQQSNSLTHCAFIAAFTLPDLAQAFPMQPSLVYPRTCGRGRSVTSYHGRGRSVICTIYIRDWLMTASDAFTIAVYDIAIVTAFSPESRLYHNISRDHQTHTLTRT